MKTFEEALQEADLLFDHWTEFTDHCLVCGDFLEEGNDTGICFSCEMDTGLSQDFLETCEELSTATTNERKENG